MLKTREFSYGASAPPIHHYVSNGFLAWIGDVGGEIEMLNQITANQKCGKLTSK